MTDRKISELPQPLKGRAILEEAEKAGSGLGLTDGASVMVIGMAAIIQDLKGRIEKLEEEISWLKGGTNE